MPRLFMALRLEDRLPIVEILKRTPDIPETCQWAMFLRNHDELTLEMVTDEERDYMYRVYASDQRARINLGIRRRLAPLLGNDRSRIEVMNALLFSMPGTPVIYYGDEIGMGDNVYLGDRNGVRTLMQWSPDRNAGFSSTNPQRLYLPVNIDPAYHYEAINVESQRENANSLLNWTKRLIALRKQYRAFGRGTLEFLFPSNQKVLAYIRRYEDEIVLVVANLSRYAQAVQLELRKFGGYTPVELFGRTDFPTIGDGFYPLTLGPNSFFWFALEPRQTPVSVSAPTVETRQQTIPALTVLSLKDIWDPAIRASIAAVLPRYIRSRRWFQSKDRRLRSIQIAEMISVGAANSRLAIVRVEYAAGDPETYSVPLGIAGQEQMKALREEDPESIIADINVAGGGQSVLYSALRSNDFCTALIEAFARRRRLQGEHGSLLAERNRAFRQLWGATHPNLEPSVFPSSEVNTAVRFGDRFVLKMLRKLEPGVHPGVEMGELFTEKRPFANAAPFAGYLQYQPLLGGEPTVVGLLHGYVPNEGNAWQATRHELHDFIGRVAENRTPQAELRALTPEQIFSLHELLKAPPDMAREMIGPYLDFTERMGMRIAQFHRILGSQPDDPAFAPEPFNDFYRQSLYHGYIGLVSRRMEFVRQHYSEMAEDVRVLAARILEQESAITAKLALVYQQRIASQRLRFHGRLHLAHLLVQDGEVVISDFEGDPSIHVSERRLKRCPLRDVASMLVSFGYAAQATILQIATGNMNDELTRRQIRDASRFWYAHVCAAFVRGYWKNADGAGYLPKSSEDQEILVQTYMMERALLDVRTDVTDRPEFGGMPFRLILHLLDPAAERQIGE